MAFAEAGAKGLVIADIDYEGALQAAKECQKISKHPEFQAKAVHVDVADEASVESMIHVATHSFGRTDCNVNSAGVGVAFPQITYWLFVNTHSLAIFPVPPLRM